MIRLAFLHMADELVRPGDEVLHIGSIGMPSIMLPSRQLSVQQSRICRRHPRRPVVVTRRWQSVADERQPWRALCNQFMRVDGNIVRVLASEQASGRGTSPLYYTQNRCVVQ